MRPVGESQVGIEHFSTNLIEYLRLKRHAARITKYFSVWEFAGRTVSGA